MDHILKALHRWLIFVWYVAYHTYLAFLFYFISFYVNGVSGSAIFKYKWNIILPIVYIYLKLFYENLVAALCEI